MQRELITPEGIVVRYGRDETDRPDRADHRIAGAPVEWHRPKRPQRPREPRTLAEFEAWVAAREAA